MVTSLVNDILMPIVGILIGGLDFTFKNSSRHSYNYVW
ncbi:hypothetical protein [uncultured Holdemanella sp.]